MKVKKMMIYDNSIEMMMEIIRILKKNKDNSEK